MLYSDTEDFLAHYGVKGMKWGVRRDKELAAKRRKDKAKARSQKREAQAKEYDKIAAQFDAELSALTAVKRHDKEEAAWLTRKRDKARQDAQDTRTGEGRLSPRQKKMLKGAAIAGGVLAAYGVYRVVNSGEMNRQIMKGKALLEGRGDIPFLKNDELSGTMTSNQIFDKVVRQINPEFGTGIGSKMNCRRCTFAYELRRRGYDVQATRTPTAFGQTATGLFNAINPGKRNKPTGPFQSVGLSKIAKDGTQLKEMTKRVAFGAEEPIRGIRGSFSQDIMSTLAKKPNGSRGELGVIFNGVFGHSMAWEVINGTPTVFDAQTGKKYTPSSKEWHQLAGQVTHAGLTRLDNKDLDFDFLARWAKDA